MKSEEIQLLLASLREMSITDTAAVNTLKKIRTHAMATKGGVQRLVKLTCVPCILKLLYRYVSMDKTETDEEKAANEKNASVALSIVANLLTDKEARRQVKRDGMETLVTLLSESNSEEVKLRCCRSLSNLAMELSSRPVLAQAQAVPALVKVIEIQYIEVEKPQTTDTASKESGKESSFDSDDVDIEAKFPSVSLVEAACRVLRYVFGDSKLRQQLVEAGIVRPLAMLMKSEDSVLAAYVLRTLSELWMKMNKRITEKMASEVSRAGIIPKLLELIDSEDDKLSQQAFNITLPLARHPQAAALIGASDGVDFFLSHLDSPRKHIVRQDLISALCQLAREAVNRVKLRTADGLKVLLDTLQDDSLDEVQDRVISCLISFLYDDTSLDSMLDSGLVDILLTHLQRCGNYTSNMSINLFESAEMLLQPGERARDGTAQSVDVSQGGDTLESSKDDSDICEKLPATDNKPTVNSSKFVNSLLQSSEALPGIQTETSFNHPGTDQRSISDRCMSTCDVDNHEKNSCMKQASNEQVMIGEIQENVIESPVKEEEEEEERHDDTETTHTRLYSINSPTYQAQTTWRMEDYHPGVTCKSYNTNQSPPSSVTYSSDDCRTSPGDPYSPLSMQSYFSPSHCSQQSPSHSSPASSPAYSYATLSPANSMCGSPDYEASPYSPGGSSGDNMSSVSSPQSTLSPDWERNSAAEKAHAKPAYGQLLLFSSSDEDDDITEDTEAMVDDVGDDTLGADCGDTSKITTAGFALCLKESDIGKDQAVTESTCEDQQVDVKTGASVYFSSASQDCDDSLDEFEHLKQSSRQKYLTGRSFFRVRDTSSNDDDGESAAKRRKMQSGSEIHACTSQNNILILLSRLSVRNDLSQRLATFKVLLCLTDHLALADQPQDRCVRILSRVMTSPHCFATVLKMCAPATIVRTLMLDSHGKLFPHDTVQDHRRNSTGSRCSRTLSFEQLDMRTLMTMSMDMSQNTSKEAKLALARSQNVCGSVAKSSTALDSPLPGTLHTASDTRQSPGSRPDMRRSQQDYRQNPVYNNEGQNEDKQARSDGKKSHLDLARMGGKLLEDLSHQALSPYGDGVIMYTFQCRSPAHQLLCSASLLFLQTHWSPERRQQLLFHRGAVERVLSGLCTPHDGDPVIKEVLVLSLVYLSRSLHITPRFKPADTQHLLAQALHTVKPETKSSEAGESAGQSDIAAELCGYTTAEKDLQITVGMGQTLHASREVLVKNSSVFAAMLQGSYMESTQSQVSVNDACYEAMSSVLHYLHCCDQQCPVLRSLNSVDGAGDVSQGESVSEHSTSFFTSLQNQRDKRKRLKHLLDMIALADRFLLPELVQYLCAVVSTSLLDENCAEQVFRFAAFHGLSHLAEDCMLELLLASCSVSETASGLIALVEGEFGSEVSVAILSLLKGGLINTP